MKAKAFLLILLLLGLCTHLMAQNNALDFDGSDDYITIPANASLNNATFTVEFWVKMDDTPSNYDGIVDKGRYTGSGGTVEDWYFLSYSGGMTVEFGWPGNAFYIGLGDNEWHHIVGLFNGTTYKAYLDGELFNSVAGSYSPEADNGISLGKIIGYSYYFNGHIEELRIWNDERTENEIKQNMHRSIPNPSSDASLVAYYPLDGNLNDASANSNNGSVAGGSATYVVSPAFFGPKNCLDFDGSDDYVDLGNSSDLKPTTALTLECWMNPESWSKTGIDSDNFAGNTQGGGYNFALWATNTTSIDFAVYVNSAYRIVTADASGYSGWHHVAGTFDGRYVSIYVDGDLKSQNDLGSTGNSISYNSSNSTLLGAEAGSGSSPSGYYYNGKLDEVRFWNVARTNTEICENMCKMLTGNETGLVGYYTFDRNTGDDLPDFSGDDNNGTLHNMEDADWESSTAFNTWLNTSSSDWGTAANWSRGSVPSSTDNVGVHDQSGSDPNIDESIDSYHLVVGSGVELTFNYSGSHTIHGSAFNIGHTNINPGNKLTITKSLYMLPLSSLDLEPGGQLSIGHNIYNNILGSPGDFTLESDATGTGSLILTGTVDGSIKAVRFLTHDRWHYISDPVNTSGNFDALNLGLGTPGSSSNQFYRWDESYTSGSFTGYWIDILNGADGTGSNTLMDEEGFVDCKGYANTYVTTDKTITLSGPLHTTNQSISLTKTGGSFEGANLVGNPFSSTIAINTGADGTINFLTQNAPALDDSYEAIYLWDESAGWDGKSNADYDAVSNSDAAFYASPGQGFMVMAASNGATLNFNTSIRKHGTSVYYKNGSESDYPGLRLYAATGEQYNKTEILFISGMTPGLDPSYDVGKMKGNPEIALYTRLIEDNGVDFAIQALPPENIESWIVTVGIDVPEDQQIEFAAETMQLENLPLYLEDRKSNTFTNLKDERYTTWVDESGTGRFFLHFKDITGMEDGETSNPLQVYHHHGILYILNPDGKRGEAFITDISGRQLLSFSLTGSHNQQETVALPAGIYFISIQMIEKMQVYRVFIK